VRWEEHAACMVPENSITNLKYGVENTSEKEAYIGVKQ
jgi:hypothetical protein